MTRILLASNSAACRSSYGIVTREIWTRILKTMPNIEVAQHGWFHHTPTEEVPWQIYPTQCTTLHKSQFNREDMYGEKTFRPVINDFKPDIIWRTGDPWMCEGLAKYRAEGGYNLCYYCPIDSEPYNARWAESIALSDELVTYTNYGKEVLKELPGLQDKPIPTIGLGYDQNIFSQASKEQKSAWRKEIGNIDDSTFVLGWIGKDQQRKQVWQLYELMYFLRSGNYITCKTCGAITPMEYDYNLRTLRDRSRLRSYDKGYDYKSCWHCKSKDVKKAQPRSNVVLWTHMRNNPIEGYDLLHLAHIYKVMDYVFNVSNVVDDTGLQKEVINCFYNSYDAFIYSTGGEGFGCPALEAMACGVPMVYSNYSGHTDFAVGLPVRVKLFPEIQSQRYRALVDMGDLIKQTIRLIDSHNTRQILIKKGLKRASKMTWDHYTDKWISVIERLKEKEKPMFAFGETI